MSDVASFNNVLSDEIAQIVHRIYRYSNTSDFSLHPKLLELAYRQIVKEGKISFGSNNPSVRDKCITLILEQNRNIGKELAKTTGNYNFTWTTYDKCVELCQQHTLDVVEYLEPPIKPTTIAEGLKWLNVTEIKPILKKVGQKVSGKRSELEARLIEAASFTDIEDLLNIKYQEKLETYKINSIILKYELFSRQVTHRAYFLRSLSGQTDSISLFIPELHFLGNEDDERKLAQLLDEKGYSSVIQNHKVCRLLPLYPCSHATITFKYQSSRTASSNHSNQVSSQSRQSSIHKLKTTWRKLFS